MEGEGFTVAEAGEIIGVSKRQVFRLISEGKLATILVPGRFGMERRVLRIPNELLKPLKETPQPHDIGSDMSGGLALIKHLTEENLRLAGQLGAAQERIRGLEGKVLLLESGHRPWWKRVLRIE